MKRRILIYSHDTFGLGNIRRMLVIAEHLVETDPEVSVLILSGSPLPHAFRIPPRVDYVKLPCLTRTRQGDYAVKYLDLQYDDAIQLRSNLILSTVLDFKPQLFLVDKKPLGVSDELSPALNLLSRRTKRPRVVLLLRDILDSPEVTSKIWRKNGYHQAIESFYDLVLVVGSQEIFDPVREYGFPPATADRVRFCGYLDRRRYVRPASRVREEIGLGDHPLVLVTAGGGEDGYHLLSSYLQGVYEQPLASGTNSLLMCGPEMSKTDRARIAETASHCTNVIVNEFTDDMASYVNAADVVVSMGGYNTICEILAFRKRAIIVPRIHPVTEQWIRAQRMEERGLLRVIHPLELSPRQLRDEVSRELSFASVSPSDLYRADLSGLDRVTQWIRALLRDETLEKDVKLRIVGGAQ